MSNKAITALNQICQNSKSTILLSQLGTDTQIGLLRIVSCQNGIHSISRESSAYEEHKDENFVPINKAIKPNMESNASGTFDKNSVTELENALNWLKWYFAKKEKSSEQAKIPNLCFPPDESTNFEREVWLGLLEKIKFGETVSYKKLAELVGHPNAARAVGSALKKNPIPFIVPCHRVIRTDGILGNYNCGGTNIKEFLIQHEQKYL